MNKLREQQHLAETELRLGLSNTGASWHNQYSHSSTIYVGGLPPEYKEDDVLAVFEQYGIVNHVNLVKDKKTQKLKGFCFLTYEDQRSTVLAVDNFNGIELGVTRRKLRVDHVDKYQPPEETNSTNAAQQQPHSVPFVDSRGFGGQQDQQQDAVSRVDTLELNTERNRNHFGNLSAEKPYVPQTSDQLIGDRGSPAEHEEQVWSNGTGIARSGSNAEDEIRKSVYEKLANRRKRQRIGQA